MTASQSEEAELYRRHHRDLQRAVSCAVDAPRELIEDACQNAWTILLWAKPSRASILTWLYTVATHEANRLCEAERRYAPLDTVLPARSREAAIACSIDDILEAREALEILASLPDRQREDLTLQVAGFSYKEIGQMTDGRTPSTVRKHLAKARARIRRARQQRTSPPAKVMRRRSGENNRELRSPSGR